MIGRRMAVRLALAIVVGALIGAVVGLVGPMVTGPSGTASISGTPPVSGPLASSEATPTAGPTPTSGATLTPSPPTAAARVVRETRVSPLPTSIRGRAWEPTVATHPTDPDRIAVIYQHRGGGQCGLEAVVRTSHDAGLTWQTATGHPGTGRGANYHATIAWGPGPTPGSSRLYYANTSVPRCDYTRHSASVAYSDDEGATWSKQYVENRTPPWKGGFPDIVVDRDPASPNYGVVYVAYNWLADPTRGPGLHILASVDFGQTWIETEVPVAATPAGFGDSWRIAYRLRTAPDGGLYASFYQADLRVWDKNHIFAKGGLANTGRIGFSVARLDFDRAAGAFTVQPAVMAAVLPRNEYTVGGASAPGASANLYVDPAWLQGFDVDPVSGRLYLAVGDYRSQPAGTPRGSIVVYASDDQGRTWTHQTIPAAPEVDGRVQSSFKPNLVAGAGYVMVAFHTLDDVAAGATVGNAYAVSFDGGVTWRGPVAITTARWRATNLAGLANGPGLRERAERTAGGDVFFTYGDGRLAGGAQAGWGAVFGALITVDTP
jgi:hypothetical protein